MSIDVKRAMSTSFAGTQSYIALAIGTIIMLPYAWSETMASSPLWVDCLGLLGVLLLGAYCILVMRAQYTSMSSAEPPPLPAWQDHIADLLMGILTIAVAVVVMYFVFIIVETVLVSPLVGFLLSTDDLGTMVLGRDPSKVVGRITLAWSISATISLAPIALFGVAMMTHYACDGSFKSLFHFRTIVSVAFGRFWTLLAVLVLAGLGQTVFEALTSAVFPLYAFVEFVGAVILANLLAQVYISKRFPPN